MLRLAKSDGAVGMAQVKVQFLIVEDQLKLHVRVLLDKLRRAVGKPTLPEANGGRHAQLSGWRVFALGQPYPDAFQF